MWTSPILPSSSCRNAPYGVMRWTVASTTAPTSRAAMGFHLRDVRSREGHLGTGSSLRQYALGIGEGPLPEGRECGRGAPSDLDPREDAGARRGGPAGRAAGRRRGGHQRFIGREENRKL